MAETLNIGAPPITVKLKRSGRARRFSLRISNVDGGVSLTMPNRAAKQDAVDFAHAQEGWLRKHLDRQPERFTPRIGGNILFDGQEVEIVSGQGRRVLLSDGHLQVPGAADQVPAKIRAFLRTTARDRMAEASTRYATQVGRSYSRITLRDTRSRWGSCTSDGHLMYSWRLVMAPRRVQDYVAAHEVCHLIEMNHSAAYWANVERIFPDYKTQRDWLRTHGSNLHRYCL